MHEARSIEGAGGRARYSILIPRETVERAESYLGALRAGGRCGGRLAPRVAAVELDDLDALDLLGRLVDTKAPQIFAESAVSGNGSDWTLTELGLLGDISIGVPVEVYDNGAHRHPIVHDPPFDATLVFTPGALLRNGRGCAPADLGEVTDTAGAFDAEGYYGLYRRRLLPVLRWIDQEAGRPRSAFVTVPGLGCGQFAGRFEGTLHEALRRVLRRLLIEHGAELGNIAAIYYDPFEACDNSREAINGISFLVRPLRQGNPGKSQLCRPETYAEPGDDFGSCRLFSLVAWDHVSWPGNDFFGGARSTDDGVKAAATSSMAVVTGVAGRYDPRSFTYRPPSGSETWQQVVETRRLRLWDPQSLFPGPWSLVPGPM